MVEDSVNKVGVDLNTASASLLEYISGVSKAIAKNIVVYREENGRFTAEKSFSRLLSWDQKHLSSVQASCVLQAEPIHDATSVHPESYEAASVFLRSWDIQPEGYCRRKAGRTWKTD